MKIAFALLVLIHGLIHLMGFFKSQGWMDPKELSMPISKGAGFAWLLAFLSLIINAGSIFTQSKWAWAFGFTAAIISQILIVYFWKDAKFGSIPNILILIISVFSWGNWRFDQRTTEWKQKLFIGSNIQKNLTSIDSLPPIVQLWLQRSGALDQTHHPFIHLTQDFKLKMSPEQKEWYSATAEQWFNSSEPGFIWTLDMNMMSLVHIKGRDRFMEGKGEMLISLFATIPFVHASNNTKIDQGSLQRFLGETVWFPAAVLNPHIRWENLDSTHAMAIMEYRGTRGEGIFQFSPEGEFLRFSALRYMVSDENATQKEWIIDAVESKEMDGIRIPVHCRATWKLDTGDWTWAEIRIKEIDRNFILKK